MELARRRLQTLWDQARCVPTKVEGNSPVGGTKRAPADPDDLAHRHQLVEEAWAVARDAAADDVPLDDAGRQRESLQLEHDLEQAIHAARPRAQAVPLRQEARHHLRRHRLDLAAERGERAPAQHAQHLRMAVLPASSSPAKLADDHVPPGRDLRQRRFHLGYRQEPPCGQVRRCEGDVHPSPSAQQRPPSSAAIHRPSPAIRTLTERRSRSSACNHSTVNPRAAASLSLRSPSRINKSWASSWSRGKRSGRRPCSSSSTAAMASGSSSSRRSSLPSSSARSSRSSVSACARRSARGASPSYMNSATYEKSSEDANGDARSVSTATTRTSRARMERSRAVRAGMSK